MSIRKRLASFIILMTGLLVIMGGLLFVGGPVIIGAFRHSLEAMNSLNSIRELRSHVLRQRASLNQYLLVGDQQELLYFDEELSGSRKIIETAKSNSSKGNSWVMSVEALFLECNKSAERVEQLYKQGNKSKAYDEATSKLYPVFGKLLERVNALEAEKSDEVKRMYSAATNMSEKAGMVVVVVLGLALLMGIILFRSLYRSVMNPLEKLRRGADEFGKGHWDFKIDTVMGQEFGLLAKSFNAMADNVKQLQEQAIHMDRMSAVGQLAGGVAHEINNPLTGVLGQAQILLAKTPESAPAHQSLKKIEQAALRCKKIVRGLLDFSRPTQVKFEDIDANELLLQTMDLCEADLKGARVVVDKKFAKNLPRMEGNPSELQQVLLNLVNNAIQAMPNGGTLTIETRSHNKQLIVIDRRKAVPPKTESGPWVEIVFRDSGVGIAKEHLTRIFEPFFTTKEIGKGTGLGLSVSMGIVRKHGGDLSVESPGLNKGASFRLTLPVKKAGNMKLAA